MSYRCMCLPFISSCLLSLAVVTGMPENEYGRRAGELYKLGKAGKIEEARKRYDTLKANEDLTLMQRVKLDHAYASACCFAGEFEEGLAAADEGLKIAPEKEVSMIAALEKTRGWALLSLGRLDETIAASERAVKLWQTVDDASAVLVALALNQIGDAQAKKGNKDEAVQAYDQSFSLLPSMGTCRKIMGVRLENGEIMKAAKVWFATSSAEKVSPADMKKQGQLLLNAISEKGTGIDAVQVIELRNEVIGQLFSRPEILHVVQQCVVDLLSQSGAGEVAAYEARLLAETCPPEAASEAMIQLATILKAADGNVARANAFLAYTKFGRAGEDGQMGTEDDLTDPLSALTPVDAATREKCFSDIIDGLGDGWEDCLAKAMAYRYLRKPSEALLELQKAFRLAPVRKGPLETIMDATAQVLVQITGDPAVADEYAAFQKYGFAGPDGRKGTDDDLTDPVQRCIAASPAGAQ